MGANVRFFVLFSLGVLSAASAAGQSGPSNRCVQNCGSPAAAPAPARPVPGKRDRERQDERAAEFALEEGIVYYDRRDWTNAIRSFEEALDHTPDDEYVQKFLASARSQKAAKEFGPATKDGRNRTPPAIIPPPARRGTKSKGTGETPALHGTSTAGKG